MFYEKDGSGQVVTFISGQVVTPFRPGTMHAGPGLRMFSAKFYSLPFPVNLYHGPSHVCNDHSQIGAFWQKASLDSRECYHI